MVVPVFFRVAFSSAESMKVAHLLRKRFLPRTDSSMVVD